MAALGVHPPNINSHAEFVDVATTSPGNTEVNPSPNVYENASNFNPSPMPSQDSLSTKIKTRKANRIYFIFYFFLWMFIGSLWILPPLLFYKIWTQIGINTNASLFDISVLFCLYYISNGISSFLTKFIISSHYFKRTHLFTSILIIGCMVSLQFMSRTNSYLYLLLIWICIGFVDGFITNAAPVYIYRIYHLDASLMVALCEIIANFIMIIIAMSTINAGSYQGTINFITFFGIVACLGLFTLQTPQQQELNKTIEAARRALFEKNLEQIGEQLDRKQMKNNVYTSNTDDSSTTNGTRLKPKYSKSRAYDENPKHPHHQKYSREKWYSMKSSILFSTSSNKRKTYNYNSNRSSFSSTLSIFNNYIGHYAPEMSYNPSVITAIKTANNDSNVINTINASLHTIKINDGSNDDIATMGTKKPLPLDQLTQITSTPTQMSTTMLTNTKNINSVSRLNLNPNLASTPIDEHKSSDIDNMDKVNMINMAKLKSASLGISSNTSTEKNPNNRYHPAHIAKITKQSTANTIDTMGNTSIVTSPSGGMSSTNSTPHTMNTFASSNVRKIIMVSSNPSILGHSVNESCNHTLELIFREVIDSEAGSRKQSTADDEEKKNDNPTSRRTTLTTKASDSTQMATPLPTNTGNITPNLTPMAEVNEENESELKMPMLDDEDEEENDNKNEEVLQQIEEDKASAQPEMYDDEQDDDDELMEIGNLDDLEDEDGDDHGDVDSKIALQLRIHATSSQHSHKHKKTKEMEIADKEKERIMKAQMNKQISAASVQSGQNLQDDPSRTTAGFLSRDSAFNGSVNGRMTDYTSGMTDYASGTATNTPRTNNQVTPIDDNQTKLGHNQTQSATITAYPNTMSARKLAGIGSNTANKSMKRVIFSDFKTEDHSNKSSFRIPSVRKMMSATSENNYWFPDLERKLESISLGRSRNDNISMLASYMMNDGIDIQQQASNSPQDTPVKSGHKSPRQSFTNSYDIDVNFTRQSTAKTFIMRPIEETKEHHSLDSADAYYSRMDNDIVGDTDMKYMNSNDEEENKYNMVKPSRDDNMGPRLNNNVKNDRDEKRLQEIKLFEKELTKDRQTLYIFVLLITMIASAQKLCYLTFITIYVLEFVGGKEFIGLWLVTVYLSGNFMSRIFIIWLLKKYREKNILLVCQFLMLINCIVLLMVDWLHIGKPINNTESKRFTKLMLYIILFIAGLVSSPIYVGCFGFLAKLQSVNSFISNGINISKSFSNSISIILMSLIINNFGIETFPYYITLILFIGLLFTIVINIKYMLYVQRRRSLHTAYYSK